MYKPSPVPPICKSAYNASFKSMDTNLEKKATLVMNPVAKNENNMNGTTGRANFINIDDASSGQTHSQTNAR